MTAMLHPPYGPGIGPGPFTVRTALFYFLHRRENLFALAPSRDFSRGFK